MMPDQNGIYITKKQASVTAALLVILGLLLFIAGYFWGKQHIIDGYTQKTSQESFNDQVDYLLTMQSFAAKNGNTFSLEESESKEQAVEELLKNLPDALEEEEKSTQPPVTCSKPTEQLAKKSAQSTIDVVEPKQDKHYATLAGFAKKASALQMVQRLKKRNIRVEIKTKTSKAASGKVSRVWYQVVTSPYNSVQDVQDVVDKILNSEKIKRSDIKII